MKTVYLMVLMETSRDGAVISERVLLLLSQNMINLVISSST